MLQFYATHSSCLVISVGYRLAPEHPFPQPGEDCVDAADYLVRKGQEIFGAKLRIIAGEVSCSWWRL
jgi:acetyl esterase/lipase